MSNPRALLERHGIAPRKSLGQNFLHDPQAVAKIADSAKIKPDDIALEIGPGTGVLTAQLAKRARAVYAIELDERMRPILQGQLAGYDNVHLIFDDFLRVNLPEMVGDDDFVVAANVPYYITSPILLTLLEGVRVPRQIVLTIQQEVAERIIAAPPQTNRLAVVVGFYGETQIITRLSPAAFWPRPDVDSAVIRITPHTVPPVDVDDTRLFMRVVKAGFSQKRKQLRNALSGGLAIKARAAGDLLEAAGIDPTRRAETLALDEWAALCRAYQRSL